MLVMSKDSSFPCVILFGKTSLNLLVGNWSRGSHYFYEASPSHGFVEGYAVCFSAELCLVEFLVPRAVALSCTERRPVSVAWQFPWLSSKGMPLALVSLSLLGT